MMHNTTPPKTPPQAEQSAAQEIKTALSGFVSDVAGFHADTQSKLQKQEKRLNELDRTAYAHRRPALSTAAEIALPHQKAFNAYLRTGDEEALRGLDMFESKALSSGVSADGGYLVDPQTADTIQSVLRATSSLRSVANVVNVEAASYDVLIDHTDLGSGWVSESGSVGESTTPSIERISIPLYELSAMPKASQRLLDDSAFDVETWLAQRIADKFPALKLLPFSMVMARINPRAFCNIVLWQIQVGAGARLVMFQRAKAQGLMMAMRWLIWFMLWVLSIAQALVL